MVQVLNKNQLESILTGIQNDDYYTTFIQKLTHLSFGLAKFHCFADGNKREAIIIPTYFLELNGYENISKNFIKYMENIIVYVADGIISKELLQDIFDVYIQDDFENEDIKFKIYKAIDKI